MSWKDRKPPAPLVRPKKLRHNGIPSSRCSHVWQLFKETIKSDNAAYYTDGPGVSKAFVVRACVAGCKSKNYVGMQNE